MGVESIIFAALPEVFKLIQTLIDAGKDPVAEIRRIRELELDGIERDWDAAIDAQFGRSEYEKARDTQRDVDDPYADLDAEDEW